MFFRASEARNTASDVAPQTITVIHKRAMPVDVACSVSSTLQLMIIAVRDKNNNEPHNDLGLICRF